MAEFVKPFQCCLSMVPVHQWYIIFLGYERLYVYLQLCTWNDGENRLTFWVGLCHMHIRFRTLNKKNFLQKFKWTEYKLSMVSNINKNQRIRTKICISQTLFKSLASHPNSSRGSMSFRRTKVWIVDQMRWQINIEFYLVGTSHTWDRVIASLSPCSMVNMYLIATPMRECGSVVVELMLNGKMDKGMWLAQLCAEI